MRKPRGRVPEAAHMLAPRAQVPAPVAMLPIPVVPKRIAAAYLGVAEKTLDDWIAEGVGPRPVQYVKGGKLYFRVATLDQFIEDREQLGPLDPEHPPPRAAREEAAVQ